MPKTIAFCADGTWDNSGKNTNVYRLYNAIATTANQARFYDDGVGVDGNPIEKLTGAAFGDGLFQKIKDGYTRIAQVYEQADNIFLFGFSRGAYTARSLAGMIAICGLPTQNPDDQMVETAFQAYRDKDQRAALLAELNAKYAMFDARLTMVGVWDTVGALGIPAIFGGVGPLFEFLDTTLHPDVRNAYQSLAIDERRAQFMPTLWTGAPVEGQQVEQVWFTGVHSDVGGSYADDANGTCLADVTLGWIMSKAAALGLAFAAGAQTMYTLPLAAELALDTLHHSWNPLWGFPKSRTIAPDASIADSVAVRCVEDHSYRPGNLQLTPAGAPAPGYHQIAVVSQAAAAGA